MADIGIERKGPALWPWVAALAIVVALIWIWTAARGNNEPQQVAVTASDSGAATGAQAGGAVGTTGGVPAAVGEYHEFATPSAGSTAPEIGRAHDYTAEGLRKLGSALKSLGERNAGDDTGEKLARFKEVADRLQRSPSSIQHADMVHDAFTRAVDVIASFRHAPDTGNLRTLANGIDPRRPLLDQQQQIRDFFRQSAQMLMTISHQGS